MQVPAGIGIGAVMLAAAAMGCSGPAGGAGSGSRAAYDEGRYAEAHRAATQEHASRLGTPAEEAALIAGLAAHALGHTADAEHWLRPLVHSTEDEIAGRATAELGIIEAARGNTVRAAGLYADAGRKLDGDEGARANLHAGDAFAAMGRAETARYYYGAALADVESRDLRRTIELRARPTDFTVQLGAFASSRNARRVADRVTPMSRRLGFGVPRIIRGPRELYVVQVGDFDSRDTAMAARIRLGGEGIVARVSTQ